MIHHSLKRGGGVGKTEEHDSGFKQPAVGLEGGFPFIAFFDANIIIALAEVQFGEDFSSFEFINQFGY